MKAERIASQCLSAAGSALFSSSFDLSKIVSMPGYNPKHLKDIEDLVSTVNPLQRRRRPRIRKRDPSRVPRPVNCFLAYRLEKQKLISAVCPGVNHREISKAVAKWWSEEPEYEKEKYRQLAELDKQLHKEKYPNYKYSPRKKRSANSMPPAALEPSLVAAQLSAMLSAGDSLESYIYSPVSLDHPYEQLLSQPPGTFYPSPEPLCPPSQMITEAHIPFNHSLDYQLQGSSDVMFGSYGAALGDSTVTQNGYYFNVADTYNYGSLWNTLVQPQPYATPSLSATPSTVHMSPAYGSTNFPSDITVRLSDVMRPTDKDILSIYPLDHEIGEHGAKAECSPHFDSFSALDQPVFQDTDFSTGALIGPFDPTQTRFDDYAASFA